MILVVHGIRSSLNKYLSQEKYKLNYKLHKDAKSKTRNIRTSTRTLALKKLHVLCTAVYSMYAGNAQYLKFNKLDAM